MELMAQREFGEWKTQGFEGDRGGPMLLIQGGKQHGEIICLNSSHIGTAVDECEDLLPDDADTAIIVESLVHFWRGPWDDEAE